MGIIRKTASFCTIGLIDWKSDKERIATYTKGARRQSKKQTKIMREQGRY